MRLREIKIDGIGSKYYIPGQTALYTQKRPAGIRDEFKNYGLQYLQYPSALYSNPILSGRYLQNISITIPDGPYSSKTRTIPVEINGSIRSIDAEVKKAIAKMAPSIVFVRGLGNDNSQWSGSGTIVDPSEIFPGYAFPPNTYAIITNDHVAPKGETKLLTVTTPTGKEYVATVLRSLDGKSTVQDKIADIAILIIQTEAPMKTARIAKTPPEQGDTVLAFGHSLGLPKLVVTKGMISQPAQMTGDYLIAIQADAPINPGNSGGPLVRIGEDGEPEIIGTNTYTFRGAEDMTFAIPISRQLEVAQTIFENGEYIRGAVGFEVKEFTLLERQMTGFPLNVTGAKISWIDKGSEIDKAGLKVGDVISRMEASDGSSIDMNFWNRYQTTAFFEWIHARKPGTRIRIYSYLKTTGPDGEVEWTSHILEIGVTKMTERTSITSDTWGFTIEKSASGQFVLTGIESGSPAEMAGLSAGQWSLLGISAKEISQGPVLIRDLEVLKELLIILRESEARELVLYLQSTTNPALKIKTILKRKVQSDVAETTMRKETSYAVNAYLN